MSILLLFFPLFLTCETQRTQVVEKSIPYKAHNISIRNPVDGIKLAGTLTVPDSTGVFPAVLLVTGAGPHNRDEEMFGHRPFYVLADYLTRHGMAVLRMDKRGCGGSEGTYKFFDIDHFVSDALVAVTFLKNHQDVNSNRIGVIGHSQGGLVAPILASQSTDIAFIILMAGPGLWGKEFFYLQSVAMARAAGFRESENGQICELIDELFPILMRDDISFADEKRGKALLKQSWQFIDPESRRLLNLTNENVDYLFSFYRSKNCREYYEYDPGETLKKVQCPVLAINGAKDVQVSARENLAAIKQALQAGGNLKYTIVELPELNHMFQTSKTGSAAEYPRIKETISPSALKIIDDWIVKIVGNQ